MREKIFGFGLLVIAGLILNQCTSADRNEAGEIVKSGDVSAFDIQIGDCFKELPNTDGTTGKLSTVSAVPCREEHSWEAFHKDELSLSEYSEEEVSFVADEICNSAGENLIRNMSATKFDAFKDARIYLIYPTFKSWIALGDRSVDCFIGNDSEFYFTSVFD